MNAILRIASRSRTIGDLFGYFMDRKRVILMPMLLILLAGGVLLVVTGGLSFVAPFIYTIF